MTRSGLLIGLVSGGLGTAQADDAPPSADFLAYLGQMEQIDGEWVDPMSVEDLPVPEQDAEAADHEPGTAEEDSDDE